MENQIDLYYRRKMLAALRQVPPAHTYLLDTFFKTIVRHTTKTVEFDLYKGDREIAAFVNPRKDGKVVEKEGFTTKVTQPAYSKEKIQITPDDTRVRSAGNTAYDDVTPTDEVDKLIGQAMERLRTRQIRLKEVMAAQSVFTGAVDVVGDGYNTSVSFGYTAGNAPEDNVKTLSGSSCFDVAGSKPLTTIDKWRLEMIERCGLTPDICLTDAATAWALLQHSEIKEMLDIQNYNLGEMRPTALPRGISRYGRLFLPSGEVELLVYNEWYKHPVTGITTPMVPRGKMLIASTEARCELHYGMIQNMKALRAVPNWPSTWEEQDGSCRWVQLETAPMVNIFQVDAFTVANVLSN